MSSDSNREPKLSQQAATEVLRADCSTANAISALYAGVPIEGVEGPLDLRTIWERLAEITESIASGDLSILEELLAMQTMALQSMFTVFISKAGTAKNLELLQCYTNIGLRAQNQCRQTVSTLQALQQPNRATFIRQQNNAIAQQINESPMENMNPANKLFLEGKANEANKWLEGGKSGASGPSDSQMETVGAVNRTKNNRG